MHWVLKDIKSTSCEHWLIAQGVPSFLWHKWKDPSLFLRVPHRCQMCGKPWRPDIPDYKETPGGIIKTVFGFRWVNIEYGLVRETGQATPHYRAVCQDCVKYHGVYIGTFGGKLRFVNTRERSVARSVLWLCRDVKYWTLTILKFANLWFQTAINFARQPKHFIKCRKAIFK